MATFPILSKVNFNVADEAAFDGTLKSEFENGKRLTRPRFTGNAPRKFEVNYKLLTKADYLALKEFEQSVKIGADSFIWYNPIEEKNFTVRLEKSIKFKQMISGNHFQADLEMVEV